LTFTFAVAAAGADDCRTLRVHHTADAPAASLPVRLGSDAHVPVTEPLPTAALVVQAVVDVTGHAVTATAFARAVELPDTTDTVVVAVPARVPVLLRVIGFVIEVTVDENVVVSALVPATDPVTVPIVVLAAVVPEALQRAQAALDPPPTNTAVRSTATRSRRRRFMRRPAFP
jgi:hypothetical protein